MPNAKQITLDHRVEAYLDHLDDPTAGLDMKAIAAARKRAEDEAASDKDRFLARIELDQTESVDDTKLKSAFYAGVRKMAKDTGIPVGRLKTFFEGTKVPAEVLANLDHDEAAETSGRKSAADIQALAEKRTGEFTVALIVTETGASKGTVTKALDAAAAAGTIVQIGESPKTYRRAA